MAEPQSSTFEEQIQALESVVKELEMPELPLEQAMQLYEQGVILARKLNQVLVQAQQRIELLARDDAGELSPKPYPE
jgi:exodeoxyribonuclease VII small subunit